jgi:hypothetical protein
MIKKIIIVLMLFCIGAGANAQYNLVIVGGNPGGIMAAIAAAKLGKSSVILERTTHIGGLPANGLGATDIATRGATTGLFTEFVGRVKAYYIKKYGEHSEQVKMCSNGYHFESSVAEAIFEQMLAEYKNKITVLKMRQFDAEDENISMTNNQIKSIKILNRITRKAEEYRGDVFIDATYEGDLGAAAKVPFRAGREGKDEFNEPGAGRVYKYWAGPEGAGSTFQKDNAIQAYNYRLCLTDDPANRVTVTKPSVYNREEYTSIIEDIWTGMNTGVKMMHVTPQMLEANRKNIQQGNATNIPGDQWGIAKISSMVPLPNHKADGNNQHMAFISTDLPEENWPWPTSEWDWRDKFAERLKNYTLGLIYFIQNDAALPANFKAVANKWGLAKDEYTDNGNFPRQVYIREGRRFEGQYFFTANDALAKVKGGRPPVHSNSVTASHYALDSHAVRKREPGRVHLDGFISYETQVYTVPFGVIVPKKIKNLLLPVPVSGSHIGFSTIRMEPCWMALGQAAGAAASLAINGKVDIQNINLKNLQDVLLSQKATLIYYQDAKPEDPDFKMIQYMGLRGYLPGWKAMLAEPATAETITAWEHLSGLKVTSSANKRTRGDVLMNLYSRLNKKY